jgi:hypothetical protein
MDFCIIAEEIYDVFSLARWLNPFHHISGIFTDTKTKVSYFRAKFIEGEYQVEKVNGVGNFNNYMSICY